MADDETTQDLRRNNQNFRTIPSANKGDLKGLTRETLAGNKLEPSWNDRAPLTMPTFGSRGSLGCLGSGWPTARSSSQNLREKQELLQQPAIDGLCSPVFLYFCHWLGGISWHFFRFVGECVAVWTVVVIRMNPGGPCEVNVATGLQRGGAMPSSPLQWMPRSKTNGNLWKQCNVVYRLVWGYRIVSTDSKIIL